MEFPTDVGYVYAPLEYLDLEYVCIPFIPPTLFLDSKELPPRKGILTKYGKKLLTKGAESYSRPENDKEIGMENYI